MHLYMFTLYHFKLYLNFLNIRYFRSLVLTSSIDVVFVLSIKINVNVHENIVTCCDLTPPYNSSSHGIMNVS